MTACAKLTASASAPRRPSRTSRRQVNNWPADNPYLRAVADTRRGALALSATIRRFSSGVQRRRAPVWITSSRDTFDIVVCSVIRLCLRGFIPQRKAAVAGGLRRSFLTAFSLDGCAPPHDTNWRPHIDGGERGLSIDGGRASASKHGLEAARGRAFAEDLVMPSRHPP